MLMLAAAVATAIPLLSLYAIYRLDRYGTRAFRLVLLCAAWGIVATRVAFEVNTAVLDTGRVAAPIITRVIAPVVEEIAKAMIIAYLVLRPRFTYFVDGAIYGFAVGIGFAVAENYHYLWSHQSAALTLALGRVVSTNLMHASTTAFTGIALGMARFEARPTRRWGVGLAGLGLSMLLHIAFNTLVTRFNGSTAALYALAAGYGVSGALGVAGAIRLGLRQATGWIRPALAASHRVAAGEIAAIEALEDAPAVLAPIEARFGERAADDVHTLLQTQARLGILLQHQDHLPEGEARREVDEEVARLHAEMDERRRAIGVFCMLHVRAIAPDPAGPLWRALDAAGGEATEAAAAGEAGARAPGGWRAWRRWRPRSKPKDVDVWRALRARTEPRKPLAARWWRPRGEATGDQVDPTAAAPRGRAVLTGLAYAGVTAAVWLGPGMIDLPGWATAAESTLGRITLQWLATLGFLAAIGAWDGDLRRTPIWPLRSGAIGPRHGDLWHRAAGRLDARARHGSVRRRLASKAGHLIALAVAAVVSAVIWMGPRWLTVVGQVVDPATLVAIQVLAQVAVVVTLAAAVGRVRPAPWLATIAAIAAAIVELARSVP